MNDKVETLTKENKRMEEDIRFKKERIKILKKTIEDMDPKKRKVRDDSNEKVHKFPTTNLKKKDKEKDKEKDINEVNAEVTAVLATVKEKEDEIRSLEAELSRKQDELNEIKGKEKSTQTANDQKLRDLVIII